MFNKTKTVAGNRRLREIIARNIPIYKRAKTKGEKGKIIVSITKKLILASPSKTGFVKLDTATGRWTFIGYEKSKDKVGHAIRKATQFHSKKEQQQQESFVKTTKRDDREPSRSSPSAEDALATLSASGDAHLLTHVFDTHDHFMETRPPSFSLRRRSPAEQKDDLGDSSTFQGSKNGAPGQSLDNRYHRHLALESPAHENLFEGSPRKGVNPLHSPLRSHPESFPTSLPAQATLETNNNDERLPYPLEHQAYSRPPETGNHSNEQSLQQEQNGSSEIRNQRQEAMYPPIGTRQPYPYFYHPQHQVYYSLPANSVPYPPTMQGYHYPYYYSVQAPMPTSTQTDNSQSVVETLEARDVSRPQNTD